MDKNGHACTVHKSCRWAIELYHVTCIKPDKPPPLDKCWLKCWLECWLKCWQTQVPRTQLSPRIARLFATFLASLPRTPQQNDTTRHVRKTCQTCQTCQTCRARVPNSRSKHPGDPRVSAWERMVRTDCPTTDADASYACDACDAGLLHVSYVSYAWDMRVLGCIQSPKGKHKACFEAIDFSFWGWNGGIRGFRGFRRYFGTHVVSCSVVSCRVVSVPNLPQLQFHIAAPHGVVLLQDPSPFPRTSGSAPYALGKAHGLARLSSLLKVVHSHGFSRAAIQTASESDMERTWKILPQKDEPWWTMMNHDEPWWTTLGYDLRTRH